MFYVAHSDEIKEGKVTDVYFDRTKKIVEDKSIDKKVIAEITVGSFPKSWDWAVLSGIEEVINLLEGEPVDVYAMKEGTLFKPNEPVLRIEGYYEDFGVHETALLGFLSQSTGVATSAARCKIAANFKPVYSFGIRHVHPAISPMIDRSAFIGGCDGVSGKLGAKMIDEDPVGTIPHALIILAGNQEKAWKAFDEVIPEDVPRTVLVDTYSDEKDEAIRAVNSVENLEGVRLDTPSSRRGNFEEIIEEVKWELKIRGYEDIDIFLSGGLNEEDLDKYNHLADAFGVGSSISTAPSVDFALDLVEVEGKFSAKRGKYSGKKQVWNCNCDCNDCEDRLITLDKEPPECSCGEDYEPLLKKVIEGGEVIKDLPNNQEIRNHVLEQIKGKRCLNEC